MFALVLKALLTAGAILLVARFVPGISVESFGTALGAAVVLGVLNLTVKPVLTILTLPITIVTLGLFLFVLNAATFALAAWLVPGFDVAGFIPALLGSILVTVVSTVAYRLIT